MSAYQPQTTSDRVPQDMMHVVEIERRLQENLARVFMWTKYSGIRPQSCLDFTHSVTSIGSLLVAVMSHVNLLDTGLLMRAFHIHRAGTAALGHDTPYVNRTPEIALAEFQAFIEQYTWCNGDGIRERLRRAYLLQHCLDDAVCAAFPREERLILGGLRDGRGIEARVFGATVQLAYIVFALEQYHHHGHAEILTQVLRNQLPAIKLFTRQLEGFSAVWPYHHTTWCEEFLKRQEGRFVEEV